MNLRTLIAALFASLIGCATNVPAGQAPALDGGAACPPAHELCNNWCAPLNRDPDNCGACGNACAAGVACVNGLCANPAPTPDRPEPSFCQAGLTSCDGRTCVNASSDVNNCGACGRSCASNQACSAGACVNVVSDSCPGSQSRCSGSCCDMQTDPRNCGSCGNTCGTNQSCTAGRCVNNTPVCGSGTILCGGACVDPSSNANNCGACGNACPSGWSCTSGACDPGCRAGETLCGGTCRNFQTDNSACGRCGNVCGVGMRCVSGTCQTDVPTCASTQTLCSGSCRDLQTDSNNCGICGRVCGTGTSCSRGACQPVCETLNWCSGRCIDRMTDVNNCGGCGIRCSSGQSCMGGHCGGIPRAFHRERVQMTRSLPIIAGQRTCTGYWQPVTWNSLEDHTVEELRTSSVGWNLDTWRMTEGTAILKFQCSNDTGNWLNLRALAAAGYTTGASLGLVIRIDDRPDVSDLSPIANDPYRPDVLDASWGILVAVPSAR